MKTIIAMIQPFVFEQQIMLFENGELKMRAGATMKDLADRIFQMSMYDEVTDITLKGSIDYISKIKEEIKTKELTEYGQSKLDINLVP